MKKINIYQLLALLLLVGGAFSCEDFLDEENRQSLTNENAFDDPQSFDQLVANGYDKFRTAAIYIGLDIKGTDIATRSALITGTDQLNDYVNIDPTNGDIQKEWERDYALVSAANTAIDRLPFISDVTSVQTTLGLAECYFFRAYAYFRLVQHFGGVPLVLEETLSAKIDFARATEQEVYDQILLDIDDAINDLPEAADVFGRLTKDAARHLKAKVLLSRGYTSFAGSSDFADAASLAAEIAGKYELVDSPENLHSVDNTRNSEVILSLLFGPDPINRGPGNNRHQLFKFTYDVYPGLTRTEIYGRSIGVAPTPFLFDAFESGDLREPATFRRAIIAVEDSEDGTILIGDTAIFFPRIAWSQAEIDAVPYAVINPEDYFESDGITQVHYPMGLKFDDPTVPYGSADGVGDDGGGFRDAVIFRSGEAHLIAAEAYMKDNKTETAVEYINALRNRAGLDNIAASDVTIDLILDEGAKELAGEVCRWCDLKRTGTLRERVLAHNPHAALNNAIQDFHYLRPIPQSEIDLSAGSLNQNPGY